MHIPVLLQEVLKYLNPRPNQNFIDCTINGGGHSLEIIKQIRPNGKVLGIDWDAEVIKKLENKIKRLEVSGERIEKKLILVNDNYTNLRSIVEERNFYPVNGILLDIGFSSFHPEESKRGFSFQKDEPLDMRYNTEQALTAKEIVNKWPEQELVRIFREFGEEKRARAIARSIVWYREKRSVEKTTELVGIIKKAIPTRHNEHNARYIGRAARYKHLKIHPATRVFQALRIAVNNELENLEKGLEQAVEVLAPQGRLVIISFHSLEDRIVKNLLKEKKLENKLDILTKKPIPPAEQEIQQNPRSRSAKLRAAVKL